MKLKKDDIISAQAVQIVSNTVRLQTILEILHELDIIDAEGFNNRVDKKYKELEKDFKENNTIETEETEENTINYYGTVGKA